MLRPAFQDLLATVRMHAGGLPPAAQTRLAAAVMGAFLGTPLDFSLVPPVTAGSYTLQPERMADTLAELRPMHQAHWEETEEYRHGLVFAPDYETGLAAEASGEYLLLTARTKTGELAGNYTFWLTKSRHTGTLVASEDAMYIAPRHRRGRLFKRFADYGEQAVAAFGAMELRLSTKTTNDVGQMLPRMGYRHVANQYVKLLGGAYVR